MTTKIASLENIPASRQEHLWADYIELLASQNRDKEISKSDVLDRLSERRDLGEASYLDPEVNIEEARVDDRMDEFVTDCFRVLEYRAGILRILSILAFHER
jgi:hypothetical protein